MDLGLRDKVCLVTGSTGGIGLETARLLAAEGARVAVTGRDSERVKNARDDAGAAVGGVCDLAEAAGPAALVGEVAERLGPIACPLHTRGGAVPARVRA